MGNWIVLFALGLVMVFAGCKKDNKNTLDDKDGDGKPDAPYTQVGGNWEWIGKQWLHLPSDHGRVGHAFMIDGQPHAIYTVDLGAQVISKLDYYDGNMWVNIGSTGSGQIDYARHQGKMYQVVSGYYGSVVFAIGGNTVQGIDTISTNSYNSYYLGSTGANLYRFMCEPSPTANLQIERWDGTDFVFVGDFPIDSITFGLPDITVEDGVGEIYITTRDVSRNGVQAYVYSDGGTLQKMLSLSYEYGARPKLFTHKQDLYIMEGPTNAAFTNRYQTIKRYEGNGNTTMVISYAQTDTFILEAYPTSEGLIYTLGVDFLNTANTLTDVMVWNEGATKRYNVLADSASVAAAVPSSLFGGGNLYQGGVYFFYNNQLHVLGNSHSGVFASGGVATKVYFGKYIEQ